MEQHAVPQHIAAFQFRLFGNLTPKQFLFVGSFGMLGFLIFVSPLPALIKYPFSLTLFAVGLVSGLVPIQGRSFDKWLIAFFKAVFSPTQRIWHKEETLPLFLQPSVASSQKVALTSFAATDTRLKLEEFLRSLPKEPSRLDQAEEVYLQGLDFRTALPASVAFAVGPIPREEFQAPVEGRPVQPAKEIKIPTETIPAIRKEEEVLAGIEEKQRMIPKRGTIANLASEVNFIERPVIAYQTPDAKTQYLPGIGQVRVRKLHFNLHSSSLPVRGEKKFELSDELRKKLGLIEEVLTPKASAPKLTPQTQEAKKVIMEEKADPKKKGEAQTNLNLKVKTVLPDEKKPISQNVSYPVANIPQLTDKANIISGIVFDPAGNIVENAIILINNEQGTPVRAVKTNKLGQFVFATPLPNGTYSVEAEKEDLDFDIIKVPLTGSVTAPVEVKAK